MKKNLSREVSKSMKILNGLANKMSDQAGIEISSKRGKC